LWRRRVDADTAALREEHASSLNAMRAALTEAEAIAQASEARLCSWLKQSKEKAGLKQSKQGRTQAEAET